MSSIGETLRRERQRRNLELDHISRDLKISSRFLQAIEDDRFDLLPAGVFAKSFVRQYATLLGLDADELAADVQRMLAPEPTAGAAAEPGRESLGVVPELTGARVDEWQAVGDRQHWSSSLPAFALVVVVMLVCSGLYAFWQRERRPATSAQAAETARPVRQQAASQTQPVAAAVPTPEPPQQTAAVQPLQQPVQSPVQQQAQPAPAITAANPPVAAGSVDAGRAPVAQQGADRVAPSGPVRLEITATEPVWVLARANGKYLFSGTLDPNQTKSVETNGTLLLRVGNAGGLHIVLNGKPVGSVGPKGQIRDVQFTSGGFQIVAPPKPPSPPGA